MERSNMKLFSMKGQFNAPVIAEKKAELIANGTMKEEDFSYYSYNSIKNQAIKLEFVNREVMANASILVNYVLDKASKGDGDAPLDYIEYMSASIRYAEEDEEEEDPQYREVYTWWIVTNWFAEKLQEQGEVILSDGYNSYWGRCTSGQAIYLDNVISDICSDMEILEGQTNDWSK
jgi:hypothetical protein